MIEFGLFLLAVFIIGFIVLVIINRFERKRGQHAITPWADEVTIQFAGRSAVEQVERQALPKGTHPNSHWFEHTFCRNGNRKKVK